MQITAAILDAIGRPVPDAVSALHRPVTRWSVAGRAAAHRRFPLGDINALFDQIAVGHAVRQVVIPERQP